MFLLIIIIPGIMLILSKQCNPRSNSPLEQYLNIAASSNFLDGISYCPWKCPNIKGIYGNNIYLYMEQKWHVEKVF